MTTYFDLLSHRSDAETFEPGEPIYREHEPGSLGFFLLTGEVELERDGRAVGSVAPGEIFGEEALLGTVHRGDTARARTATTVVPIGPALFKHLANEDSRFEWRVRSARRRRLAATAPALIALILLAVSSALSAQVWEVRNRLLTADAGPSSYADYGRSFAVGDFDGDGHDDLAIGAPGADLVEVFRGGASGLSAAPWTILTDPQPLSQFGVALAAGDFDGDQRDELAVGAAYYDVTVSLVVKQDAGKVFVFGFDGGTWDEAGGFTQATSNIPGDPEPDDKLGWTLLAADFNADDYDDLAVGVPFEAVGAVAAAGAVNVIYGASGGLSATGSQLWYRSGGGIDGTAAFALLGISLASGDFDGDHVADLAIGAPTQEVAGSTGTGEVIVLFGAAAGSLQSAGQQRIDPTDLGFDADGQLFGTSLAAAELLPTPSCVFTSSCASDLAIGAPGQSVFASGSGLQLYAGRVHVVFGSKSANGLDVASTLFADQYTIDSGFLSPPEFEDEFGTSLAAGDLDGLPGAELVVGVPYEAFDGVGSAGAAHLLFGGSVDLPEGPGQFLFSRPGLASAPQHLDDSFGRSLAIGDFDGDGARDLVIGLNDRTLAGQTSAGAVQVFYGSLFADGFESGTDDNWSNG